MMTSPYIEKMKEALPYRTYLYWFNPRRMDTTRELRRGFPDGIFTWDLEGGGRAFAFPTAEDLARFERDFVARWRTQL